jgi:DNA-binding NtrC family response regulator
LGGGEVIDLPAVRGTVGAPPPAGYPALGETLDLREAMASFERRLILTALERSGGNRSEAARSLGIARTNLYAKMEEHGIALPERSSSK